MENWGAGDSDKWRKFDTVSVGKKTYDLVNGEHKHSYSSNSQYAVVNGEAIPFSGHRYQFSVQLDTKNYMKESGLSGDEIRKGGSGKISVDGTLIFEFFIRDIEYGLKEASKLIDKLQDHSSDWISKEARAKLVGRKIFYREIPSVITRLIVDQGCIIVATEDGSNYPPPVYSKSEDGEYEVDKAVKVDIFDPNIWWFRD